MRTRRATTRGAVSAEIVVAVRIIAQAKQSRREVST
jgi:hypothetical protein